VLTRLSIDRRSTDAALHLAFSIVKRALRPTRHRRRAPPTKSHEIDALARA
jgi:hypothetical protein